MGFLGSIGSAVGLSVGGIYGAAAGGLMGEGGSDTIGDMVTGGAISNAKSVQETNDKQIQLAREQTAFQERMSNSAYQRAVVDMRAAGLNPALAYQNGGASVPTGQMASLTAPRKGDIGAGLMNTGKALATQGADIQQVSSQTDLNKANAQMAEVTTQKLSSNAKEAEHNIEYADAKAKREKLALTREKAFLPAERLQAKADEKQAKVNEKAAYIDSVLDRVKQWIPFTRSNAKTFNIHNNDNSSNYSRP